MSKRCDHDNSKDLAHWLTLLRNGNKVHEELSTAPNEVEYQYLSDELAFIRDVSIWTHLKNQTATEIGPLRAELELFEDKLLAIGQQPLELNETRPVRSSPLLYEFLRHHIVSCY